jgi:uncharacterized protein YndB with AHSA1/START domain
MNSDVQITGGTLRITRVFDAPRSIVFAWWSDPARLSQWSGCKDATACEVVMDFRVGGSFTQKMRIGDKGDFTFTGYYDEIIVPERISYRADFGRTVTRVTIEFHADGDRTRIVLTQEGFPADGTCQFVAQGTSESFDKLASILTCEPAGRLP